MRPGLRVSVFRGYSPKPGEQDYITAQILGSLIGKQGFTVLTGGYIGAMEAISRGAAEAGGYVVGVTCDQIENWRRVKANRWVQEEVRFRTIEERLFYLVENCDAAIALPGGVGTLAEITVMWNQIQTGAINQCPLILVGDGWKKIFEQLINHQGEYIAPKYRRLVSFSTNANAAFSCLMEIIKS
jgi:uncharacterized protein (TIGR00730 family)